MAGVRPRTLEVGVGPGGGAHRVPSDRAVTAFRCAVDAHLRRGPVSEARWRRALRLLGQEAHRLESRPEEFLVALKHALARACDAADVPRGPERSAFVSRVVTLSIQEFYAAGGEAVVRPAERRERSVA